jgi:type I restriction enzyme S subunit
MTRQPPPRWTTTTVGKACSIRNDLRLPISREERATMKGPYPYYGPTGQLDAIADFRLDGTFALIGEDGDHFLDVEKKPQTILVSGKFNVNNHAHVIASTDLCSAEWFYNYFRHRSLTPFLTRQGAGRYKLNKAALQEIPIVLPPPAEQGAINDLFREWNTAIQKAEQLIAAMERKLTWTLRRLYERKPHWKSSCLGNVLASTKRLHGNGDYQIGSIGKRGIRLRSDIYSKSLSANHERNILVEPNWVCFGLSTDSIAYGVNRTSRVYSVSPAYRTYEIKGAHPGFIDGYLRAFNGQLSKRFLIVSARQGKAIDFDALLSTPCYFPPIADQKLISKALAEAQTVIDTLHEIAERYRAQKRGLMQKLLTGEWRLPASESETV